MHVQRLDGTWQVRHEALSVIGDAGLKVASEAKSGWISAAMPGEVHLDLMAAGLMEEPFFSTNAPACRWVEDRSWWFRTRFTMDPAVAAEQVKELVFNGLDLYAQVFFNGHLLGEARNAFVPAVFEVHQQLQDGENELVARLTAGTELAADQRMGDDAWGHPFCKRGFKGIAELRKPAFSYGWDWVDSLPNIGIWRGVRLEGRSRVRFNDVWHAVELSGDRRSCRVRVTLDTFNLHPSKEYTGKVRVRLLDPDGESVAEDAADRFFNVGVDRWRTVLKVDGRHVFSRILPEACLDLDPERPCWPGSPAGGELVVRVVNDTLTPLDVTVHQGWLRVDGTASEVTARPVAIPVNDRVEVARSPVLPHEQRPHDDWIFATWADGEGVEAAPCVWTLLPHRQLKTVDPCLRVEVEDNRVTLTASAYAHGVGHDDRGERRFSDNWFDLLPDMPKVIECRGEVPADLRFAQP